MIVKKFNESLRDKMTGKTLEGVIEDIETKINDEDFDPSNFDVDSIINVIVDEYEATSRQLLILLLDSGAIDASMVLDQELENLKDYIRSVDGKDAAYMIHKLLRVLKQKINK